MKHFFLNTAGVFFLTACGSGVSPIQTAASRTVPNCTMATEWTTVDDFQGLTGQAAAATQMISDTSGNLYVTGYSYTQSVSNGFHWLIRKSTDKGQTWSMLKDFQVVNNRHSQGSFLGLFPSGLLFSLGQVYNDGTAKWKLAVRRSSDLGVSWSTLDVFQYASGQNTSTAGVGGIVSDKLGNLFVVTNATDSSGIGHFIIRKSSDNGDTWSTSQDYQYASGKTSAAETLFVHPNGTVYVVGYGTDSSDVAHGILMSTTDAGIHWTINSDYQLVSGKSALFWQMAADLEGNLIMGGYAKDETNVNTALVLKSTDNGATWTVLDNYRLAESYSSSGHNLVVDGFGTIYAGINASSDASTQHIVNRKGTGIGDWVTINDTAPVVATKPTTIYGMYVDESNNIYNTGYYWGTNGANHWLVQKLACVPNTSASTESSIRAFIQKLWSNILTVFHLGVK